MKEKMKHKRKQEETYFKFLKDLQKSEEDEIIFQLEEQLAIRQEILKQGVLKKKQHPYVDAVSMIEKQLSKAQNDISTVYRKTNKITKIPKSILLCIRHLNRY